MNIGQLISLSCFTGFFGDAGLQFLSRFMGGPTGWGLKAYFKQHGSAESLFIASGMMTLFYVIYIYILGFPISLYYLAIYGIILDYIFRVMRLFPSLDGYYKSLNYFWSAFWGAIPLMMPLIIYKTISLL
jgi:hypothetical protein